MPESDGTLRDILQGFNTMQARLGLTAGSAQATGIQPLQTIPIKHPGEISQQVSMQMQQQVQATAQQVQQIRQLQPANAMGFMPPGGLGGGVPAGQDFARQYQERMQQIQSGYQQPFQAQQMAQNMGMQGFQGMPSPVFMTPPSMGVFRPGMMPPPPISMARTPPLIQTPFTPQLPAPMFQTPLQMQQAQQQMESNEMFAGAMAGIPTAARMAMGGGGVALGMRMGGRFGTAGRIAGGIAGGLLGFGPGGALAEQGAASALQPAIERRAFGLQMQNISRNFVVSGADLAEGGRGLTMQAGIQTTNAMRRAVDRGETAGFNMRDMMGITSMAGDMGMMDMAQNSEQIVSQAKNVARGLSAFMRLANEPDVRRAMQQMSQMRAMGLTVPETTAAMQNAQQFARMAGTTVASLGQSAGMPGAMTFQRLGMTAGLGMQVGMGAGAMARQAVAGGAFTPGQLAMAGGVSGVGQQLTEAAGAGLGVTFPMMAALERNAQGKLTLNQERVQGLASGRYSLTEQAGMAQQNIEQLGGARAITELSTRLNELRDQMGRMLGPQGSLMYTLQQGLQMQKELGGPSVMGIGGALRALGLDPQQARTMEVMAQSPQFWRNMHQQMQQQIDDSRQEEATRRERMRETSTLTAQMQRGLRPVGRFFERGGEMISGAYEGISQWWSDRGRRERAGEQGQAFVRLNDRLRVSNQRVQRQLDRFVSGGGFARFAERQQDALREGTGDVQPWETAQSVNELAMNTFTGGLAGAMGLTSDYASRTALVQSRQAMGGLAGKIAEWAPNLAYTLDTVLGQRQEVIKRGRSIQNAARQLTQGTNLSNNATARLTKEARRAFDEYQRQAGTKEKGGSFSALQDKVVQNIVRGLEKRSSWTGDKAMSSEEMRQEAIKTAVSSGTMTQDAAENFYSKDRWEKQGLGALTSRRVRQEATPDAEAALAKTLEGGGLQGVMAGRDLETVVENLNAIEERTKETLGFYEGLDATEQSYKAVTNMIMTNTSDEVLAMQALALRKSSDEDERAKGNAILKNLRGRLGDKADKLIDKMGQRVSAMSEDNQDMMRRAGMALKGDTAEAQEKEVKRIQQDLKGTRAGQQIAAGAARLAEKVEGLQGMARGGFTDEATVASMQNIMADSSQMEELSRMSPEAMAAIEELRDAGEDPKKRAVAVRKFQRAIQRRGAAERGEMTLGGRGVGGRREQGLEKQMGTAERMAAQLTGNADEDFARTVPLFAKATAKLNEAAEDLRRTAEVNAMDRKMGRPR